ncbi:MAG: glycosyltransferase, partial [Dehalococcoidia bacterium]
NRDREFKLVVIGGNDECEPELERLRNLSRDLNIQDIVVFIGTVRQEDLPFYYSAADVCVVPSYYESFGLVALESLACGTPVVATRVGGMESVVLPGKNGYLINDNAPALFAESIAMLISGRTAPGESAEAIRSSVTGFSWSNIAAKMIGEYKALLGESAKETN